MILEVIPMKETQWGVIRSRYSKLAVMVEGQPTPFGYLSAWPETLRNAIGRTGRYEVTHTEGPNGDSVAVCVGPVTDKEWRSAYKLRFLDGYGMACIWGQLALALGLDTAITEPLNLYLKIKRLGSYNRKAILAHKRRTEVVTFIGGDRSVQVPTSMDTKKGRAVFHTGKKAKECR